MKKKKPSLIIMNVAIILVVIITLSVLLYPTISAYINSLSQSRAVNRYMDEVSALEDSNKQELLDSANQYNDNLRHNIARFEFTKKDKAAYEKQLNTGLGVMGILTIDKIGVNLPIYHGSDEGVLQIGLGHMMGTSLPVGGVGTHAFITGHRGLPSSTLLTNLDKMVEGDTFVLYVLGETLTYEVDDIKVVKPNEVKSLEIDPEMDYCTLVTCTPYGINSHRMLVRGHRVENALNDGLDKKYADAERLSITMVILIFAVLVVPVTILFIIIKSKKIRNRRNFF